MGMPGVGNHKMKSILAILLFCLPCLASDTNCIASWYNPRTNGMVAASYQYPIGTRLKVTELNNDCWVLVTVIERGPRKSLHRQIDLSRRAFEFLDGLEYGLAPVRIEVVKP